MEQKMSFEESLKRLNEINSILSSNDVTLDRSIELFKEALDLSAYCKQKIDEAKLTIEQFDREYKANE